jgi:hypothetical protein
MENSSKMPVRSVFRALQGEAWRSRVSSDQSIDWFKNRVRGLSVSRTEILADEALKPMGYSTPQRYLVGSMFLFRYEAKYAKKLPYWDKFPLILLTDFFTSNKPGSSAGFAGLNLHYLPPTLRIRLFQKLLETAENKFLNDDTKMQINYGILKSASKYKYFEACYKRYLPEQLKSPIVKVPAPEWEIAVVLPVQEFTGASSQYVWSKSVLGKAM